MPGSSEILLIFSEFVAFLLKCPFPSPPSSCPHFLYQQIRLMMRKANVEME